MGPKFHRNHYLAQFSRYKHFCVLGFLQKTRKFKINTLFGGTKIFENWVTYSAELPYGSKMSSKLLSSTVFEIQAFLCFAIFAKNSKIQNGRHFLASEIFVETSKG